MCVDDKPLDGGHKNFWMILYLKFIYLNCGLKRMCIILAVFSAFQAIIGRMA